MCPKAKLLIHQTWAYETGSERIKAHGFETYDEMFSHIKSNYEKAAELIQADGIVPSGEAFQCVLQSGVRNLHRDTFHASYGIGRYLLARVWYRHITGNDIRHDCYCDFDEFIDNAELLLVHKVCSKLK